ncbi:TPA: fumarate hydratase, partial [Salmonella enterica]|nr:fumarate hydratase [Salmonella enterica subsp. enterica serovar Enteritidis]HAF7455058.1 fumarate hydratase [Salmonella enterica]
MQHSTGGSMSRILNTEIIISVIEKLVKKACYELDDN